MKTLHPLVEAEVRRAAARRCLDPVLTTDDLDRWDSLGGLSPEETLDAVSLWVAERFDAEALAYETGDGLMNDLYTAVVVTMHLQAHDSPSATHVNRPPKRSLPDGPVDPLWWQVYLAFDSGEYQRMPDEDPVALYTRPEISRILAELRGSISEPAATS